MQKFPNRNSKRIPNWDTYSGVCGDKSVCVCVGGLLQMAPGNGDFLLNANGKIELL